MKIKNLGLLAALLCADGISFPHTSHAQGPGGPPPPPQLSGSGGPLLSGPGGPPPPPPGLSGSGAPLLSGSGGPPAPPPWSGGTGGMPTGSFESLTTRVAFVPTSGTTTSAVGMLQAISVSGTDHGSLGVHTMGLGAGTYTVDAVTDSSTTPVTLGTFDVKYPRTSGTLPPPPNPHMQSNTQFGGPRGIPFPDGFDPFDIASLAISDSNANVLFTADLTTISNAAYYARIPIVSGTTVTATGVAEIHAFAKSGVINGTLTVMASGLPASTAYTYAVDGTDIATVTTGSAGSLRLMATESPSGGTLPSGVDLFTVTSVTVHDGSGNVILSASF